MEDSRICLRFDHQQKVFLPGDLALLRIRETAASANDQDQKHYEQRHNLRAGNGRVAPQKAMNEKSFLIFLSHKINRQCYIVFYLGSRKATSSLRVDGRSSP